MKTFAGLVGGICEQRRSVDEAAAISLDRLGGDVWAWEKRVTGMCPGCPPRATISLLVNEKPVLAERDGETFSALAQLDPGQNEVVAVATLPNGSVEESTPVAYNVSLEPRPTARLAVRLDGERVLFDATGSTHSEYDPAFISHWMLATPESNPAPLEIAAEDVGVWSASTPTADGEYYASLTFTDENDRTDTAAAYFVVEGGRVRVPDPIHENAAWIDDAVIYGVAPRNFDPPGFQGVASRLDDLADLGISALWLAPITQAPAGDFGYAVSNYFEPRPEYGTKAELKALVEAAHERGIRVLLDFVPNHTSIDHPYFRDAEAHGEASHSWDFYDRDAGGNPTHYFNWEHLPNLNYDNPEVQRFMLEAFSYWVRELDVDGFRVDAVWGIKERKPEWFDRYLTEMKRTKPDSLLIAEASARDPFYFTHGFDAAYDWTDELGRWAWGDALGGIAPVGEAMREVLTAGGQGYHDDALVMRFLNNNDTGPRFLTTHGIDFYRVSLAMLLTLPGLPCLFTGDEVGAEFQPYETSGSIDWTDHHGLRSDTKKLIGLRRGTPALHSRAWLPLTADPARPLFAYLRTAEGEQSVVVILNFSGADVEAAVALPAETAEMLGTEALTDLWSGETVAIPDRDLMRVSVPGWGFRLLMNNHV